MIDSSDGLAGSRGSPLQSRAPGANLRSQRVVELGALGTWTEWLYTGVFQFIPPLLTGMTKADMTKEGKCGVLKTVRTHSMMGPAGGRYKTIRKADLKDGEYIGGAGMNPCVGVMIEYEKHGVMMVSLFHFRSGHDDAISATLDRVVGPYLKGGKAKAWIAGGSNLPMSDYNRGQIFDYLEGHGVPMEYTSDDGVAMGPGGEIFTSGNSTEGQLAE